jgi:hypothetical protein
MLVKVDTFGRAGISKDTIKEYTLKRKYANPPMKQPMEIIIPVTLS